MKLTVLSILFALAANSAVAEVGLLDPITKQDRREAALPPPGELNPLLNVLSRAALKNMFSLAFFNHKNLHANQATERFMEDDETRIAMLKAINTNFLQSYEIRNPAPQYSIFPGRTHPPINPNTIDRLQISNVFGQLSDIELSRIKWPRYTDKVSENRKILREVHAVFKEKGFDFNDEGLLFYPGEGVVQIRVSYSIFTEDEINTAKAEKICFAIQDMLIKVGVTFICEGENMMTDLLFRNKNGHVYNGFILDGHKNTNIDTYFLARLSPILSPRIYTKKEYVMFKKQMHQVFRRAHKGEYTPNSPVENIVKKAELLVDLIDYSAMNGGYVLPLFSYESD